MSYAFQPPRRRQAWLAAIALLHAAAFLSWRGVPATPPASLQRESELIFLQAPAAASPPRTAVAAPASPAGRPRPSAPPPATVSATAPAAAQSTPPVAEAVTVPATTSAQPDPFAKPAPLAETLLEKNRRLAAGVDRQLRKESLNKFATIVQPDTSLGLAIAKSQNKDWVLEQSSDYGNGVVMKRYRKGNMEYCEYVNLVGAAGQDPFRDGNKTKVMTCP